MIVSALRVTGHVDLAVLQGSLDDVVLASRTTLGLGGPARKLVEVENVGELEATLRDAEAAQQRVLVLGGGSNLVVGDVGWDGVVLALDMREVKIHMHDGFAVDVQGDNYGALRLFKRVAPGVRMAFSAGVGVKRSALRSYIAASSATYIARAASAFSSSLNRAIGSPSPSR